MRLRWGLLCWVPGLAVQIGAAEIYTCVDSHGRKLTSDRPIAECLDREQLELNPSGTVRRRIGPALTGPEQAAEDARQRKLAEEQTKQREEKRRNQALLIRYPNRAAHDKDRAESQSQVDEVIKTAQKRVVDLQGQRAKLDAEMEFYKKDPNKAPARLKQQVEENTQNLRAQQRFIADQEDEKKRVNARFDVDLARLEKLWGGQAVPAAATSSSASR